MGGVAALSSQLILYYERPSHSAQLQNKPLHQKAWRYPNTIRSIRYLGKFTFFKATYYTLHCLLALMQYFSGFVIKSMRLLMKS